MTEDMSRLAALRDLLAERDAHDAKRRSVLTQAGDPGRYRLLPLLAAAYQAHALTAREEGR